MVRRAHWDVKVTSSLASMRVEVGLMKDGVGNCWIVGADAECESDPLSISAELRGDSFLFLWKNLSNLSSLFSRRSIPIAIVLTMVIGDMTR